MASITKIDLLQMNLKTITLEALKQGQKTKMVIST